MALALDGSNQGSDNGAPTLTVPLTTTNANCVISWVQTINGGPGTGVVASGLSFSLRKRQATSAGGGAFIELWQAIAASPLTALNITGSQTSSDFITGVAFGVSGANTTTPGDTHASIPAGVTTGALSVSTNAADCFILSAFRLSTPDNLPGAGNTLIFGEHFQVTQYRIVSAPQSGLSLDVGSGSVDGALADAIVIAGAGGGGSNKAGPLVDGPSLKSLVGGGLIARGAAERPYALRGGLWMPDTRLLAARGAPNNRSLQA